MSLDWISLVLWLLALGVSLMGLVCAIFLCQQWQRTDVLLRRLQTLLRTQQWDDISRKSRKR